MPTVAVIIIGNEILTGKFADENGPFFIARLREIGAHLEHLCVVRDNHQEIADVVSRFADRCDVVITTGGVGPTHDDITFEALGQAFGLPLEERQDLIELMGRYGLVLNAATRRMTQLPRGSELLFGTGNKASDSFPIVKVRNVYALPGVPKLVQRKFSLLEPALRGQPLLSDRVYLNQRESQIAETLTTIAERFSGIDFGSYPRYEAKGYRVIVTFEGTCPASMQEARCALEQAFEVVCPPGQD